MYDAIIVGGGPAGSAAALYAKHYGLKTIVLDKSNFPRDKICGDALSGKCIRIMRELDLLKEIENLDGADINRITFGSPSYKQFDLDLKKSNKKGYVIPRLIFDNYLFQKVKTVSDTKENFTVRNILYEHGKINGIVGKNKNGKDEKIKAPVVIGADGTNSIVARKLGLYEMDIEHTSIAIRCYYSGVKGLSDQIELHYIKEVNPGYFWLFPIGEGKANIGIGLSKNYAKRDNRTLQQILNQVTNSGPFKSRFENAIQLEKPKGWNLPCGSIHRRNHGDGFMLIGDSAGIIDPFTGEGIGNAMVSGKYAMKVLSESKRKNNFTKKSFSEYDKLLWDEIGKELNTSTRLQSIAKSSFLLNFVINRAARNEEVQNIIAGMLAHEIPKEELSNPLFYFKILFS
jgi:geranylgeranyl reductase family protein